MGGGIAQTPGRQADLPVRMKDLDLQPLAGAWRTPRPLRQAGQASPAEQGRSQAQDEPDPPDTRLRGFERVDLVIEAIVEILEVKQKVFAELADGDPRTPSWHPTRRRCRSTSSARETPIPNGSIGMHFFNPVHKMPLVEIIVGERTSPGDHPDSRRADSPARQDSGRGRANGPGFLVNRLLTFYRLRGSLAARRGLPDETLDRRDAALGHADGAGRTDRRGRHRCRQQGRAHHAERLSRPARLPAWIDKMVVPERLGAKSGSWPLPLQERVADASPTESVYARSASGATSASRSTSASPSAPCCRWSTRPRAASPRASSRSPADIDLAMIMGTGFPPFRGGVCRWADTQGLDRLVDEMESSAESVGERHRPAPPCARSPRQAGSMQRSPRRTLAAQGGRSQGPSRRVNGLAGRRCDIWLASC